MVNLFVFFGMLNDEANPTDSLASLKIDTPLQFYLAFGNAVPEPGFLPLVHWIPTTPDPASVELWLGLDEIVVELREYGFNVSRIVAVEISKMKQVRRGISHIHPFPIASATDSPWKHVTMSIVRGTIPNVAEFS